MRVSAQGSGRGSRSRTSRRSASSMRSSSSGSKRSRTSRRNEASRGSKQTPATETIESKSNGTRRRSVTSKRGGRTVAREPDDATTGRGMWERMTETARERATRGESWGRRVETGRGRVTRGGWLQGCARQLWAAAVQGEMVGGEGAMGSGAGKHLYAQQGARG